MDADILHADLDAFYASVEQMLDPSLRGRPVAVGTGVVLAASYEAKAYGVGSGMAGSIARRLCPGLVQVPGQFKEYLRLSEQVMDICRDFTPIVEQISIDEAFLDVRGSRHLMGAKGTLARRLRTRVRSETGLPISVGVARTKFLAKIASQVAKPDGLIVVEPDRELDFLHPLPVELMWGVGPKTRVKLARYGIDTIGDLAAVEASNLTQRLGPAVAGQLTALAWNRDPRPVVTSVRAKSVGAQSAVGRRDIDKELIARTLHDLADRIGRRLREKDRGGRTISARIRFGEMNAITRATTLPSAVSSTAAIYHTGAVLVASGLADHPEEQEISLLGLSVSKLSKHPVLQPELDLGLGDPLRPGDPRGIEVRALDEAMDRLRDRFGKDAVGHAAVVLSPDRGLVPDGFRELAQKKE
jgi:DNA polymerase-4